MAGPGLELVRLEVYCGAVVDCFYPVFYSFCNFECGLCGGGGG